MQGEKLVEQVRREPRKADLARARWRAADLRAALPRLAAYSPSWVGRAIERLRLYSPDPAGAAKVARIGSARVLARAHPARVPVRHDVEVRVCRLPTFAAVRGPAGEDPPAPMSCRANTRHRVSGAMDAVSGRVVRLAAANVGVVRLGLFTRRLRAAVLDRYVFLFQGN